MKSDSYLAFIIIDIFVIIFIFIWWWIIIVSYRCSSLRKIININKKSCYIIRMYGRNAHNMNELFPHRSLSHAMYCSYISG